MNQRQRSSLAAGLVLILVGGLLLAVQFVPGLQDWYEALGWPLYLFAVAGGLLLIGILTGAPGMAVPACIVGGIGGIFYWQNATNNWESWTYIWALIPGFVGVGIVISGLFGPKHERGETIRGGLSTIAVSAVLFLVFGSFFGGLNLLGAYWPVLLIGLGVLLLINSFLGNRHRGG